MSTGDGATHGFFGADNAVSKLCRELDWAETALGPPSTWTDALKTTAHMVLESRFPMALGWGDDFIQIYNDGFVPILGDKHPDALGRPFSDVYSEIWDQTGPLLEAVYREGESLAFEDRFFLIDRRGFLEESYFTFSYCPVRDGESQIVGLLVTTAETTAHVLARRRAETLNRISSVARKQSLTGILSETVAQLDGAPRDIPWCAAFETPDSNGGRKMINAIGSRASHEQLEETLVDALPQHPRDASGPPVTVTESIPADIETTDERAPSTSAVWLPIDTDIGSSSREVGGLAIGLSDQLPYDESYKAFVNNVGQSLTTAVQHQLYRDIQLTNAERRYSAVFENSIDPMMLTCPDGTILRANPAACELLGYTEEQFRELGRGGIVARDERLEAAVTVREVTGEFRGELGMLHSDGHVIPCELSSKIYHNAVGEPRTSVVFRDLRQRLQLEARLRQSQKLEVIGKLAGGVAHDFNNLLTAIDASAQFLEDSVPPKSEAAADVSVIRAASDRAAALTQRLLAFSQKKPVESTLLNPGKLVEGLETIVRSLVGEGIDVITDIEPDVHSIYAARQRIEQMLLNLVVNAHDATPTGGTIRIQVANRHIETERDDALVGTVMPADYVAITVTDTGEGLPANQPEQLFEPFYTTKSHGTGLGLATVAEVVRDYSGAIVVESEPYVETRFEILLPASSDQPSPREDVEPEHSNTYKLSGHVLLIEDQPRVRKVTAKMLQNSGLEVTAASGGPEAIELFEASAPEHFDLVISDIVMPKMSGVQTARRLRELNPEVKLLFISGFSDQEPLSLTNNEPIRLVRKPFTQAELLEAVNELVR